MRSAHTPTTSGHKTFDTKQRHDTNDRAGASFAGGFLIYDSIPNWDQLMREARPQQRTRPVCAAIAYASQHMFASIRFKWGALGRVWGSAMRCSLRLCFAYEPCVCVMFARKPWPTQPQHKRDVMLLYNSRKQKIASYTVDELKVVCAGSSDMLAFIFERV